LSRACSVEGVCVCEEKGFCFGGMIWVFQKKNAGGTIYIIPYAKIMGGRGERRVRRACVYRLFYIYIYHCSI